MRFENHYLPGSGTVRIVIFLQMEIYQETDEIRSNVQSTFNEKYLRFSEHI